MGSADNNTTLYEEVGDVLNKDINSGDTVLETLVWPIAKCIDHLLRNATQLENITETTLIYNGTKVTCLRHAPVLTKSTIIRASVLSAMAVLSFFGNLATIVSIQRGKRGRGRARPSWTAIYSLIFQLSIADLLVTVFCLAGEAAWSLTVEWYGGNIGCKLFKFLQMFSLYLSTFVLVLIGVDRWLAVKYPMRSMDTATRSKTLVTIVWVLSILLSVPQVGNFLINFNLFLAHIWSLRSY